MAQQTVNQRLELELPFAREGIDQDSVNPLVFRKLLGSTLVSPPRLGMVVWIDV